MPGELAQLRDAVATRLRPPPALAAELADKATAAGLPGAQGWGGGGASWEAAWSAICQVRLRTIDPWISLLTRDRPPIGFQRGH